MTNAKFIMPEFLQNNKINATFLDIINDYPECVRENTSIYGFYGNFPGCIWNCGRFLLGNIPTKHDIVNIFSLYNNYYHLPLRLTFTNPAIDNEKYCWDDYANLIAEIGNNGMNEILVVSPVLEKYLRKNYPNYKYCRSIIGAEEKPYNLNNYYMSVLRQSYINDFEKIDVIPQKDREYIEIICNDSCIDNCPRVYEHYMEMGKSILQFNPNNPLANCTMNNKLNNGFFVWHDLALMNKFVSREKIDTEYLPRGFQHFKLCGRENSTRQMINWLDYIFKPEYRNDIISIYLKN